MGYQRSKRPLSAPLFAGDGSQLTGLKLAGMAMFVSAEQTGTGSAQNVAHGLGVVPSKVFVAATNTAAAYTVTEGTHTSTNVIVTVTTGAKFKTMAWA